MICAAESILTDTNASIPKKLTTAAAVVPYVAVKYSTASVVKAADVVAGGLMRMFR